jgi:hypothetical protein
MISIKIFVEALNVFTETREVLVHAKDIFGADGEPLVSAYYKRKDIHSVQVVLGGRTLSLMEIQGMWALSHPEHFNTFTPKLTNPGLEISQDFPSVESAQKFMNDVSSFVKNVFGIELN